MKRFLLVLAIVGVLFSACESGGEYGNENDDNSTENGVFLTLTRIKGFFVHNDTLPTGGQTPPN